MDLVNQNKFKNILIIVLLTLNLLTVSIIWMQTFQKDDISQNEKQSRPPESINLMKKALDMNEAQTTQFEKLRAEQLTKTKKLNDSLDNLKKQLAEELLDKNPDTSRAKITAREIGEMQSQVELSRFNHFKELIKICTPEQKEKLKPIMIEIFGRKPPKEEPISKRPHETGRDQNVKEISNQNYKKDRIGKRSVDEGQKPNPPSIEERLSRLNERLKLTDEQQQKIKDILVKEKKKNEDLRKRVNPSPDEIEAMKEQNRKMEDESIMNILNENQKAEFSRMIMNRKK
jgi:Spy/CpxP family protein refolding chaperone